MIFFGIKQSKISRLFNAKLPLLMGNNPISLSLVLRLCILTSDQEDGDSLSRALCLLENPLFGVTKPIGSQLRLFFMYCAEFLVRQKLIDKQCCSIGLAGFVSHLHWHEPYNIALVHLLQSGELHALCHKTEAGKVTPETMENLMIVFNFLFARSKVSFERLGEKRREVIRKCGFSGNKKTGSKYIFLPPLPENVQRVLEDFKNNISSVFDNYMNSADKMASSESQVASLPFSKLEFNKGTPKPNQSLLSPFAVLVGKTNETVTEDEFQIPDTNIKPELLTGTIQNIEFCDLNAHVLDFFHNGSHKTLIADNRVPEGEVYDILKNFLLAIKTIRTSMEEMTEDQRSKDDELLLEAITAVVNSFEAKFDKNFGTDKKRGQYAKKGCYKIHDENCIFCNLIVNTTKVSCKKRPNNKPFPVWGKMLTCETPMVVCVIDCKKCKKQYVKNFAQSLSNSCKDKQSLVGERHESHEVRMSRIT